MSKRKSDKKSSEPSNKKCLTDITGIDKDLGMNMTTDKGCQTKEIEDETNPYLLLELIASDLELSDIIIKNVDGDQIDGLRNHSTSC